uniref:Putative site-specific DNA endonuclease n=1 Tax=Tupiella akineta TaxID=160070 RepID=Q6UVV1_TUPAK|nr:putative site-specific DNA endonuclease [Tupiella akineta]AAQ18719.1 putative site-specific DNA endonuclease [Tupiella akineta]
MSKIPSETKREDINSSQLWAIGLIEGDGHIGLEWTDKAKNKWVPVLKVTLHAYNTRAIYKLKECLGVGKISRSGNMISLRVRSRQLWLSHLIPLFDKFPFITIKYYDYAIVKKALTLPQPLPHMPQFANEMSKFSDPCFCAAGKRGKSKKSARKAWFAKARSQTLSCGSLPEPSSLSRQTLSLTLSEGSGGAKQGSLPTTQKQFVRDSQTFTNVKLAHFIRKLRRRASGQKLPQLAKRVVKDCAVKSRNAQEVGFSNEYEYKQLIENLKLQLNPKTKAYRNKLSPVWKSALDFEPSALTPPFNTNSLKLQLKAALTRVNRTNLEKLINKHWLAGFIEAEGSFYILSNGQHGFALGQTYDIFVIAAIHYLFDLKAELKVHTNYVMLDTKNTKSLLLISNILDKKLLGIKSFIFSLWLRTLRKKNKAQSLKAKRIIDKLRSRTFKP